MKPVLTLQDGQQIWVSLTHFPFMQISSNVMVAQTLRVGSLAFLEQSSWHRSFSAVLVLNYYIC